MDTPLKESYLTGLCGHLLGDSQGAQAGPAGEIAHEALLGITTEGTGAPGTSGSPGIPAGPGRGKGFQPQGRVWAALLPPGCLFTPCTDVSTESRREGAQHTDGGSKVESKRFTNAQPRPLLISNGNIQKYQGWLPRTAPGAFCRYQPIQSLHTREAGRTTPISLGRTTEAWRDSSCLSPVLATQRLCSGVRGFPGSQLGSSPPGSEEWLENPPCTCLRVTPSARHPRCHSGELSGLGVKGDR